jgi:type II secretory pathway pseudopilin PulG
MRTRARGVTLIEFVIYMVIATILAAGAFLYYTPREITARYQAERLRTDLRHMQMLAITLNQPLLLTATAGAPGSYSVSALDTSTCATTALTDPATSSTFSVALDSTVSFAGTASLHLDYAGRPATGCAVVSSACKCTIASSDPAASYTVTGAGSAYSVQVRPVSGFVTVTP